MLLKERLVFWLNIGIFLDKWQNKTEFIIVNDMTNDHTLWGVTNIFYFGFVGITNYLIKIFLFATNVYFYLSRYT